MNIKNARMVLITHYFPINVFVLLISGNPFEPQIQEYVINWNVINCDICKTLETL